MKARLKKALLSMHALVLVVCVFCSLLAGNACVAMAGVKDVTVLDEGKTHRFTTFLDTVEELLTEQNIVLEDGDEVVPPLWDKLEKDSVIEISRAVDMTVRVDGSIIFFRTTEETVGEALASQDILLSEADEMDFVASAPVTADMCVTIVRVQTAEESQEVSVPFETVKKANANMTVGQTKTVQEGQNGLVKELYNVSYRDGQEFSRELISSETLAEPVNKIVEYGTKEVRKTVPSRGDLRYSKSLKMNASAYTAASCGKSPSDPTYGLTSTGSRAARGTVAVDPKVIPLGTRLYIDGYGYAVAADTGGSIKGNRIDVYFDSLGECYGFGRKSVNVYVLD